MAAETASMPINGNYGSHHGYGDIDQQNAYSYMASNNTTASSLPPPAPSTSASSATLVENQPQPQPQAEVSKDEVGWYFVEQYYTTLSRTPEKLYLFYNRRSQFVSGQEADKVRVYGGQTAINNRIKELDFKDCKVRVTNVDAQPSESNIVIQVIGEISNNGQPHKKFVQTFVLGVQVNGYFVLNDIFRYLVDEEDEIETEGQAPPEEVQQMSAGEGDLPDAGIQEPPPTVTQDEQHTLTSSDDPIAVEHDAQRVDREIEEKVVGEQESEEIDQPAVNGIEPESEDQELAHAAAAAGVGSVDEATTEPTEEDATMEEPEKSSEPAATSSLPEQAAPQPAAAPKPAAPKTWASMAAAASSNSKVATPVTPSAPTSNTSQARATPPNTKTSTPPAVAPPSAPAAPAAQRDEVAADNSQSDEWTAVAGNHNRQQSRQTNYQQQQEGPPTRAYIRSVHEAVGADELRSHLEQYGEVVYFDLSRQKSSAFVEFRTPEGYAAAVNANPHVINGERLSIEERRYGRNQFQNNRGRGGMYQGPPRGNYQNRGGYAPRGRGGGNGNNNMQQRGRGSGGVQAA